MRPHAAPCRRPGPPGVSLTELMIAMVVLTVAALGLMGVFGAVAQGIHGAKCRSLASNLAQEKIQILKQKNYYRVLVTTSTEFLTEYSPPVAYDPFYFPPETILEGGIPFQRLTHIELAQEVGGAVAVVPPTSADTNLKRITVTVAWRQGVHPMRLDLRSVMSNPDATMMNGSVAGRVTCAGVPVQGALLTVAENYGWRDASDAAGDYRINLFPGDYHLTVAAHGYFSQSAPISISSSAAASLDFALAAISSRTVSGDVWENDHPVISQVVGAVPNGAGWVQEYVEVFNPTTHTWAVAGSLGLKFARRPVQDAAPVDIGIDFTGSPAGVGPGQFYLFANTRPVVLGMAVIQPDAVWEAAPAGPNATNFNDPAGRFVTTPGAENYNIIPVDGDHGGGHAAGGLILYETATGRVLDRFGWAGNGAQSPHPDVYEANPLPENTGLQATELYRRLSSTDGVSNVWGPAYDSNDNSVDWHNAGMGPPVPPRTTAASPQALVAGTPAVGAVVGFNDGLSAPAQAVPVGVPPRARFIVSGVATGTWTAFFSHHGLYREIDNIVVAAGAGTLWVPNAGTLPAWPAPGDHSVVLSSSTEEGILIGTVRDPAGLAVSPAITVTNGLRSVLAAASGAGTYLLRTPPGVYTVHANPNNLISTYVSLSSAGVSVGTGLVTSGVDFVLAPSGGVRGWVTRDGINPLPGIAVVAEDGGGVVGAQSVTSSDGYFRLANVSTGAYTLKPILTSGESASPGGLGVNVTLGADVFAGTFTVQGAMGTVTGAVSLGGRPLQTGVLILVTTATLAGAPPPLNLAGTGGAPFYLASSHEDGRYQVDVRGSATPYRVYAYYPEEGGAGWNLLSQCVSPVNVAPGAVAAGVNFNW